MAKPTKPNRSSSNPSSASVPVQAGQKRTGNPYGIGGTLVTLLLVVLYWWFTGSPPPSNAPAVDGDAQVQGAAVTAATVSMTVAANPVAVANVITATPMTTTTEVAVAEAATTTPTSITTVSPTVPPTVASTSTPAPATATKPPKPTPFPIQRAQTGPPGMAVVTLDELPAEALDTLALIADSGPFPFARDGITFQNRERLLPQKARGYYREYTVITPGESDRGARRIIAGENGELYYTDDHYETFAWIMEQ